MNPNPFVTVWTAPRETIRQVVANNPKQHVWSIVVTLGVLQGVIMVYGNTKLSELVGIKTPLLMVGGALGGAIGMTIMFWLITLILRWTGSWISGHADIVAVRAATAFSYVPILFMVVISLIATLFFGNQINTPGTPGATPILAVGILGIASVVANVWSFVILCKMLAEVQGFSSAWKGLLNLFIPGLIIIIPIMFILSSVVLVSLNTARDKARDAAERSQQKVDEIKMEIKQLEVEGMVQQ